MALKPLNYLLANRQSILIESIWMFLILFFAVGLSKEASDNDLFGFISVKFVLIILLLSIPAGVGLHFINRKFKK